MSAKDGGPIFPIPFLGTHSKKETGMSLRDWFAGQALHDTKPPWFISTQEAADLARGVYRVADAMLAERDR